MATRIEQFLEANENNRRVSPDLMRLLHPWAFDAFEDTAGMFRLLYKAVGNWDAEHAEDRKLSEIAKQHGLTEEQLIQRLQTGRAGSIPGALDAWSLLWSLRAVKYLVMACQRYWSWAAAEQFRLRPTAALGYLRLEAEAVGLIALFLKDASLGYRWLRLATPEEGKKFFSETQARLKEQLTAFDLARVYNIASTNAQHVRMAGLIRSLAEKSGTLSLPDQEFNLDDPYSYHLALAHFHRIQTRILLALGAIVPEAASGEWASAVAALQRNSDALWEALPQRYAKEVAEQGAE